MTEPKGRVVTLWRIPSAFHEQQPDHAYEIGYAADCGKDGVEIYTKHDHFTGEPQEMRYETGAFRRPGPDMTIHTLIPGDPGYFDEAVYSLRNQFAITEADDE
jgi:hypothetical protein